MLPDLRETIEKYGLAAKKSLGQNFLLNTDITEKIIRLSLQEQHRENFRGSHVYEIGPGPGGLTRAVLKAEPALLTVIETDPRCVEIMKELQRESGRDMEIIEGDALQYKYEGAPELPKDLVSNLPYNISVPLLLGRLKDMRRFKSLTLMFQKEVADRITAASGSKQYGRLSVISQLTCNIKPLLTLSPGCFVPAPKIKSTVLLFTPLDNIPETELLYATEKLTELAFGQRRKMLRQSLKSIAGFEDLCRRADIDTALRAENLTPQQYLRLAELIKNQRPA